MAVMLTVSLSNSAAKSILKAQETKAKTIFLNLGLPTSSHLHSYSSTKSLTFRSTLSTHKPLFPDDIFKLLKSMDKSLLYALCQMFQ